MNETLASSALEQRFAEAVVTNQLVATVLQRMQVSELPHWYLSGGCLFQTVWNIEHGFDPSAGILDYDLFYFDDSDLSAHAERLVGQDLAERFADLPIQVEARNQARVPLWYEQEFGVPCKAFQRCEDGIDEFLATCCCFGVRQAKNGKRAIYAPYGFDDLFDLVVRPNMNRAFHGSVLSGVYESKVKRWSRVWPRLKVAQWP